MRSSSLEVFRCRFQTQRASFCAMTGKAKTPDKNATAKVFICLSPACKTLTLYRSLNMT